MSHLDYSFPSEEEISLMGKWIENRAVRSKLQIRAFFQY
ncbi:hypothetical protein BRLA_c005610 [Brevibacillus laterosporus LMG 15441]|uniref:Uncharacterized protein n=1 Tax=Brevibacillus laterosporus LMG 15441 TaxID=1042163 RepID=A0A075QZB1_BRELA|nr:hypothetical protein BRLA_c005610 [Brevibacillus laterosporus LMG 15441]